MARLRLQTQLLLSTLLIICALTGAILLIIRQTVRTQIADQVKFSMDASFQEFETVQRQLQLQLSRTASLLAAAWSSKSNVRQNFLRNPRPSARLIRAPSGA